MLVAFAAISGAATAFATDGVDAAAEPDAGGVSCTTTDDCAVPLPYCDETRHACVECLSDRNCASTTGRCDTSRGACVPCLSDLDCVAPFPYCNATTHRCIECRTDENCADEGVVCVDGFCGTCGDGVCGQRERIAIDPPRRLLVVAMTGGRVSSGVPLTAGVGPRAPAVIPSK